jgi:hypothetical protein
MSAFEEQIASYDAKLGKTFTKLHGFVPLLDRAAEAHRKHIDIPGRNPRINLLYR